MKKISFILLFLISATVSFTQVSTVPDPVLYGVLEKKALQAAPYNKWYTASYAAYQAAPEVMQALKKIDMKNTMVEIYFGTWCGDSRREVPRFMKVMDELAFPAKNIRLIGLGGVDSLLKQSPGHEEQGKGIFRVPVFIIYRNGKEINRINEFPALSLEKDLKQILASEVYQPNYRSFAPVQNWLADGTLLDNNTNAAGLAVQLRGLVSNDRELNSLGYLMLSQAMTKEALKIFQVNASLYPESAVVISSLGEGYYKTGDKENAVRFLERSLELNKDPLLVKQILKVLYQARN